MKKCEQCGNEFVPHGTKRFCGSKYKKHGCSWQHYKNYLKKKNKEPGRKAQIKKLEKDWKKRQRKLNTPYARRQKESDRRWRCRNGKKLKESNKQWRLANAELILFNNAQRRIRKKFSGKFTYSEWKKVLAVHGNRCAVCGLNESSIAEKWAGTQFTKLTIDHIKPLSKGGRNTFENIQPLCIGCNASKCDDYTQVKTPIFTDLDELRKWRKTQGGVLVATNGCFDLVHMGHLSCLERARAMGTKLVVGINSDESVRALKGPTRPIFREMDRAGLIAAFVYVDAVCVFRGVRCHDFLEAVQPDIYAKGGDYTLESLDKGEREVLERIGSQIKFIPIEVHESTTDILKRL